ncbi:leucyl aminopeptidase [Candidatus Riesia pediculicola]|uniref:Probable cytosol aminopeptidase n=1 Tax=Riesia pediculicola (strain USDA) TaxID=515618 RepID=D4G860_RIEPU|nr:leucyl aminopeptidase [Candidatus Riesia pediculicola]ADD79605.1 cytosol aminopeptidase [Candidatus Riesia pediculicola USDA]QOJ86403.1 leucyl aminopeptidase [Candidatus Riesia pediculicola]
MKFEVRKGNLQGEKSPFDCIITEFFKENKLSKLSKEIDSSSHGYIYKILLREKTEAEIGKNMLLYDVPNIISKKVLLVGCGNLGNLDKFQYRKILRKSFQEILQINSKRIICNLTSLQVKETHEYFKIRYAIEILKELCYRFDEFKKNSQKKNIHLQKIIFYLGNEDDISIGKIAIKHAVIISSGVTWTKDLSNMPANICNSTFLSERAKGLEKKYKKIKTEIVSKEEMARKDMNAYLSVGMGSKNDPIMAIINYQGDVSCKENKKGPLVLIGKGLTFDSGGISIKPSSGMEQMKFDMCGAATVYGVMRCVAELDLPIHLIGILACCENMPDGMSYRPGDIIRTMSGKTVEVINTDAEGRLVLCDVLTYVRKFNPDLVIDIATLTGSCVVALGDIYTGMMTNDQKLVSSFIRSSERSMDKIWQLPLGRELKKYIRSDCADIANSNNLSGGGAISAGYFLNSFVENQYRWVHLDIAGTAWKSNRSDGSTGRTVPLLLQFILDCLRISPR